MSDFSFKTVRLEWNYSVDIIAEAAAAREACEQRRDERLAALEQDMQRNAACVAQAFDR